MRQIHKYREKRTIKSRVVGLVAQEPERHEIETQIQRETNHRAK